jgi:hypothetical protein
MVLPSLALLFFERKMLSGVVMKFQLNVLLRPVPTNFSCISPVVPRSLHIISNRIPYHPIGVSCHSSWSSTEQWPALFRSTSWSLLMLLEHASISCILMSHKRTSCTKEPHGCKLEHGNYFLSCLFAQFYIFDILHFLM